MTLLISSPSGNVIDDGTTANRRAAYYSNWTVTATQTRTLLWHHGPETWAGTPQSLVDTDTILPVPKLDKSSESLGEGYRLRTITTGVLAGDNYAAPIFQVEELIEP